MLSEDLKRDDVICYFLSEHEDYALESLGFNSQKDCFAFLALVFPPRPASSFRRLRDEYDVLTSNRRRGQCLREPSSRIQRTFGALCDVSREELLGYIQGQISQSALQMNKRLVIELHRAIGAAEMTEREIEDLANLEDPSSGFYVRDTNGKTRKYNIDILRQLKQAYQGECQLCGGTPFFDSAIDEDILECHHIDYFATSHNNDASNILVVCPNHHRLLHRTKATFNRGAACFDLGDGKILPIKLDKHLLDG